MMGKRPPAKTFADIVRDAKENPEPPVADYTGAGDPQGRGWHEEAAEISPARALSLARSGAPVAWDSCGCGGYCGFEWFSPEEVSRMTEAGSPKLRAGKKHHGWLSEWATSDGDVLVVAVCEVQWGDVIRG